MSLAELGMKYVDSFYQGTGKVNFVEHLADGTTSPFIMENVFSFTSIADIKRMIWLDEVVQGSISYTPKYVFLAYEKEDGYAPIEFYWGTNSGIPALLQDPMKAPLEPNPELVDSEGNRRSVTPRMNLYVTLEDSLKANDIAFDGATIHIWRLSQIIGDRITIISASIFDGFIRLYFPGLSDINVIDEAFSDEAEEESESYSANQIYIADRQERLISLQKDLEENADALGLLSCRGIESLQMMIPRISPLPESLEILFYELQLSNTMPYLRFFSKSGEQEPIMRYLKNVYLPPNVLSQWIKEDHGATDQIIAGKILIRGPRIPVGSAFDILFFGDNSNRVRLVSPRKDTLYPGTLVEEGLRELASFIASNTFTKDETMFRLVNLQGKFVWEHPLATSAKPTLSELKERMKHYNHLFDLEPTEASEAGLLKLRYRALSNYESENEIFRYISRVASLEVSESDFQKAEVAELFAARISGRFGRSYTQSLLDFGTWLNRRGEYQAVAQGKGDDAVPLHHDGVIITIRNNHPLYEIDIANIQEQNSFSRILTAIALALIQPSKAGIMPVSAIVLEAQQLVKVIDAEDKELDEAVAEGTRASSAFVGEGQDLDFLNMMGPLDEDEDEEKDGKEEEEEDKKSDVLGAVSSTLLAELPAEALASRSLSLSLSQSSSSLSPRTQLVSEGPREPIGDISHFYINRLHALDDELFGYQDTRTSKAKGYSIACQSSNGDMPHSLSEAEYKRMKDIYKDKVSFIEGPKPRSWKLEKEYPNFTWDWDNNYDPPRPVWVTLRTGSSSKRNWFLCVKYWCVPDNLPLIESEFEVTGKCPFCSGTKIIDKEIGQKIKGTVKPESGQTVLVRRTHKGFKKYIGFQTESKHPEGFPLPCCGGKAKEDKLVDKTRPYAAVAVAVAVAAAAAAAASIRTTSLSVINELGEVEEDDEELKEQLEAERAILLEATQTRAPTPTADISKILNSLQNKYIKGPAKYPLGTGELGIVPKQIDDLFGQDSTKAIHKLGPQQMLTRGQLAFIRFGLQNRNLKPGDRFLSLLGFFMGTFNLNVVVEKMKTTAFVHAFEDANYGTLVHEFARPDQPIEPRGSGYETFINKYGYENPAGKSNTLRLYYSYMNFMEYIKSSDTVKDIRYFEHLLMIPGALLSRGILLIRIERDENSDDWSIHCPSFGIPAMATQPVPVFVIHDPKYHYWEPLILYAGSDKAIVSFESRDFVGQVSPSIGKSLETWIKSIRARGVGCGRLSTPPHTWTPPVQIGDVRAPTIATLLSLEMKPTSIVRERSNRFVGFVYRSVPTNRLFFVPARDDGTSVHQYKRVYESKSIPRPNFTDVLRFYTDNKFARVEGLSPTAILSRASKSDEEEGLYVGIRLSSGAMIPIESTDEYTGDLPVEPISDFPWEIDELLFPHVVSISEQIVDIQTAEGFLQEAYQYLRLIISNHFRMDAEGEKVMVNLQILRKSFNLPLYERRKRADMLLEAVVRRFVKETPYNEKLKELPRIRKDCSKAKSSSECPIGLCSWSANSGQCLLHAPVSDRFPHPERVFVLRLVDEILRNPYAFLELSEGGVSRVRPLKGTIHTATEIITTEAMDHVRGLQEARLRKIQKTPYTQGHRFGEEEPAPLDVLRAVLGITDSVEAQKIIEQMTSLEVSSYSLRLPINWDQYFTPLTTSPEMEDEKAMAGFIVFFQSLFPRKPTSEITENFVKDLIKKGLQKIGAPIDSWRNSPYDYLVLAVYSKTPVIWFTTALNGSPVLKYYFKPEGSSDRVFIIFWGDSPALLFDKAMRKFKHDKINLPDNLIAVLEVGPIIKSVDDIQIQSSILAVNPYTPVVAREDDGVLTEEVPSVARVEEVPSVARVEEVPSVAKVEEVPSVARVEEVPSVAKVEEVPSVARVEEIQSNVLPVASTEEVPLIERGEEVQSNALSVAKTEEIPTVEKEEVPSVPIEGEVEEDVSHRLRLPDNWDQYFIPLVTSSEIDEKAITGFIAFFQSLFSRKPPSEITEDFVKDLMKKGLEKIGAPINIQEAGWSNSPYDYFVLAVYSKTPVAWFTTDLNDAPLLKYYFKPEGSSDRVLIIFWGNSPQLLFDKTMSKFKHDIINLPNNLTSRLEVGQIIKSVDDIRIESSVLPILPVLPVLPVLPIESIEAQRQEEEVEPIEAQRQEGEQEQVKEAEQVQALDEPAETFGGHVNGELPATSTGAIVREEQQQQQQPVELEQQQVEQQQQQQPVEQEQQQVEQQQQQQPVEQEQQQQPVEQQQQQPQEQEQEQQVRENTARSREEQNEDELLTAEDFGF